MDHLHNVFNYFSKQRSPKKKKTEQKIVENYKFLTFWNSISEHTEN